MTSARNSIYSTHSVADAHLLAILDDKKDNRQLDTQGSRLSALLPTKFLETVLILSGTPFRKYDDDIAGNRQSATSFDDMQRSVQVIGLPKPERSKPRLSHTFEPEHIIDNAAFDDEPQNYDSEPQMRYTAPNQASDALMPEYPVLSDHRKLTFLEEDDSECTEEDTTMVREGVGMAEADIQVTAVRITPRGRYSSDGMAVVAAVVDQGSIQGRHNPTLYKCL
ncbi:hypothetical protein E4T52_00167 [Aureobasidium sp. EXF-3400]|nr:hypothetical protein E4T51_02006 [Aureobasidium sp. EXF-12344]KAI4784798.1 hypothetical protein E4T52_00167 [Aureobasidium sp. EXF-3400]